MMKKQKILLIMLLIFFVNIGKAQVNNPNFTRFAYGATVGGFVCTATPKQPDISEVNKNPIAGFSLGGVASFRRKKYFFETGLNYNGEGYAYSSTITTNNTIRSQQNEYKFYSIMLPLRIIVPVMGEYCKHLPSVALNFSYGVRQTNLQTTEYTNSPFTKNVYNVKTDYNRITPSFTIAYGVEFDLDMENALRFEPTFQFSFVNAKSAGNKTMINNIGLRVYFLFLR